MSEIKRIIMRRDRITGKEADELIKEAKATFEEYIAEGDEESAYNICEEYFGLEPDYIMDLIDL